MDIAITSEFFPHTSDCEVRGGVEARAFHVAKNLAEKNDVTVYTLLENGLEREAEFNGISVVRVGPEVEYSQASSLSKRFMFMRNAIREISAKSYDIVDGSSFMTYPVAWRSGCGRRVATYHDVWLGEWVGNVGFSGILGEMLERYVLSRKWDKYISVSEYTREKLVRNGVAGGDITVVHNGVDLKQCQNAKALRQDAPVISCVSRLVGYKHVDDLIKALPIVRMEYPEARLVLVGTGPELENLKSLAKKLGVSDSIDFKGFIPRHADVLEAMKSSSVYCHPSSVEGFGITLVEAMALQVPYVASDIPPFREATRGGVGGLLFTPGDVSDLASKIKQALAGDVTPGAPFLGEYDWTKVGERVLKVYEGVVGK
ncbi:MAG: glycosyltransferase family 4 protein [Candidatus Altiarchaeota archaeon]